MASTVDISRKPKEIFNREDSALLCDMAFNMIMAQFNGGKDGNGESWAPYSRRYTKTLKKLGESTKPDLIRTGKFRSLIRKRFARRKFVVGLFGKNAENKGYIAAHSERPFIGLSMANSQKLIDAWIKNMTRRWNEQLLLEVPATDAVKMTSSNEAKTVTFKEIDSSLQAGADIAGDADIL